MNQPPIAIFGAGRFGRAFGIGAARAGLSLSCFGNHRKVDSPVAGVPLHVGVEHFLDAQPEPSIVFLAVPDDAISDVAQKLARVAGSEDHWYVHVAGSRSSTELEPLSKRGCLHILQSIPSANGADRLAGSYCAITAPDPLCKWLHSIACSIGTYPFDLAESARLAYHTAAVFASNALVGLAETGRQILESAGVAKANEILLPLMRGTLENLVSSNGDTLASLTGPIARGDVETVRSHLNFLSSELAVQYCMQMLPLVNLARRSGVDLEHLDEIQKLLSE